MRPRKVNLLEFRIYPILLFAGVILFVLIVIGLLNPFLSLTQGLTLPLQVSFHNLSQGVGNLVSTAGQIGSLRGKNSALQVENSELQAENASLKKLETENKSLREQLGTPLKELKVKQTARVIGLGGLGTKNVLLIDQGQNQGVKKGDLVVVKNILLGEIVAVSPKVSSVQLLDDPDTKIPAKTQGGAEGIAEGRFGAGIVLTNVLQSAKLKPNELVMTSGKDNFPANLVLGQINKVNKVEKEFFQSATIEGLVETKDLPVVYIVEK